MSPENCNKATACMCIDYTYVTWLSQVHMQVAKLLKHKNERILFRCFSGWELAFFFLLQAHWRKLTRQNFCFRSSWKQTKMMRRTAAEECPSCSFDSLSWRINSDHILLLSYVSLQSSFTGFCDPLVGSKSHLAAARKNRNYPLNPPPQSSSHRFLSSN